MNKFDCKIEKEESKDRLERNESVIKEEIVGINDEEPETNFNEYIL